MLLNSTDSNAHGCSALKKTVLVSTKHCEHHLDRGGQRHDANKNTFSFTSQRLTKLVTSHAQFELFQLIDATSCQKPICREAELPMTLSDPPAEKPTCTESEAHGIGSIRMSDCDATSWSEIAVPSPESSARSEPSGLMGVSGMCAWWSTHSI